MNLLDPSALECLAALAEAGSFERAAQLLSITQSAVSQRLRALETQGGQLLARRVRPVETKVAMLVVVRSRSQKLPNVAVRVLRTVSQLQLLRADAARELGA